MRERKTEGPIRDARVERRHGRASGFGVHREPVADVSDVVQGRALENLAEKGLVVRADDGDENAKLWRLA
jgi:ribosomal protein S19E (S16A)